VSNTKGRRRERGFTLIELLVVLAILGLLAGIVAPRVLDYFDRAQTDAAKLQIENLTGALDLYRLDLGRYPTTQEGLAALVAAPAAGEAWRGPYVKGNSVPADPWGRPYQYRSPGTGGRSYDLFTLGADGVSGGSGRNADVSAR
jgi:general secretion pathway protein G